MTVQLNECLPQLSFNLHGINITFDGINITFLFYGQMYAVNVDSLLGSFY